MNDVIPESLSSIRVFVSDVNVMAVMNMDVDGMEISSCPLITFYINFTLKNGVLNL